MFNIFNCERFAQPNAIVEIVDQMPFDELLKKVYLSPLRSGYCEVGKNKCCMPIAYEKYADRIRHFKVRDDDIFVMGFPRSGTTWCQEAIWLIMNNYDFERAKNEFIGKRFPLLEAQSMYDDNPYYKSLYPDDNDSLEQLNNMPSPRFIKTHLPWEMLPIDIATCRKRPAIFYMSRNPKDVCISLYHHSRLMEGFTGTFHEYCQLFLVNRVPYAPYTKSVLNFWRRRFDAWIKYVWYRDLHNDKDQEVLIRYFVGFLRKTITDDQVKAMIEHLRFESMKKNSAVNYENVVNDFAKPTNLAVDPEGSFMRLGTNGQYMSVLAADEIEAFNKWQERDFAFTCVDAE